MDYTPAQTAAIDAFKRYEDLRLASWAGLATIDQVDAADLARIAAYNALATTEDTFLVADATHQYRHANFAAGAARAVAAWQQRGARLDRLGCTFAAARCRVRAENLARSLANGGAA